MPCFALMLVTIMCTIVHINCSKVQVMKKENKTPQQLLKEIASTGMNMKEVADITGMTHGYVCCLERGVRKGLSWEKMDRLRELHSQRV